jgi:Putative zinc-finger
VRCDEAAERISLALDGVVEEHEREQLDAHVATCLSCQAFRRSSLRVRQHLRFEVVNDVPDVEAAVLDSIRRPATRWPSTGRRSRPPVRWLAPAAALLAGVVAGAAFVGLRSDRATDTAAAASLSARVLGAQSRVDALSADLSITERGWHSDVPVRRYTGHLEYRAPESLAITLEDTSQYPSRAWRPNDVTAVVDRDQSWRSGLAACPGESQPSCTRANHRILGASEREPFPDEASAPLDLVVPVTSFAGSGRSVSLGEERVSGRSALGVEVTVAQADPLLDGILASGNWRELHPTDRVRLWLDRRSLVPLRVDVFPARSLERDRWAASRGYDDDPGRPILEMRLRRVRIGAADPAEFRVAPPGVLDQAQGFHELPADQVLAPTPGVLPVGMAPHRAGVVETPNGPEVWVRTWTDGRGWVKVRATEQWGGTALFGDLGLPVREVELGSAGVAYVGDGGRRIALHGSTIDVVVTGSISEVELLEVAATLGVHGLAVPGDWDEASTATKDEASRALPGLLVPRRIGGFSAPGIRVDGDYVTMSYTGAGTREFVLVEAPGTVLTPPVDADTRGVRLRGTTGRYAPRSGELEWIEGGIVVTLRSESLSLGELVRIANHLQPA